MVVGVMSATYRVTKGRKIKSYLLCLCGVTQNLFHRGKKEHQNKIKVLLLEILTIFSLSNLRNAVPSLEKLSSIAAPHIH